MRKIKLKSTVTINGTPFKVLSKINAYTYKVESTEPVPKGVKRKPQIVDVSQIDE